MRLTQNWTLQLSTSRSPPRCSSSSMQQWLSGCWQRRIRTDLEDNLIAERRSYDLDALCLKLDNAVAERWAVVK